MHTQEQSSCEISRTFDLMRDLPIGEEGIGTEVLVKSENLSCALIRVRAGAEIDTHRSTADSCLIVSRGRGTYSSPDCVCELRPGTMVQVPANTPHSVSALEDLTFCVVLSHLLTPDMYLRREQSEQRPGPAAPGQMEVS